MGYAKREREQIGAIEHQMHGIVNKCDREGRRGLTSAEQEKFFALEADHGRLRELIQANEGGAGYTGINNISSGGPRGGGHMSELAIEEVRDSFRLSPRERRERERGENPYARAFSNYLRGGTERLNADDRNAMAGNFRTNRVDNTMSTTTGSQGGYVVPQGFSQMLDEAMKWFGGADACGSFETDTGNPMPYPTINDTTNKGRIIGQNTQVIETDLIFAETTFNAYIGSSDLVLLPLALAEDSYFDMDALVARLLGIRLGRLKNNMCTVGTGVNQPTGIVTAAAAAGLTYTMATGATAGPSYADLVGVEHSIDNAYRQNADGTPRATWMFNDLTLKGIKKLLDSSGRPLWQSGLTTSMAGGEAVLGTGRPNILGYPYVINDDILPPTANAQSLIFGDLSKFIVRKLKSGTTVLVLRERYADYLQLGFIAFQRFDSNLIDAGTHPICVASNSST